MTRAERVDVTVVGAGAAGIGIGVALSKLECEFVIVDREKIGASFRRWPEEMRFITPSFPSNSFGLVDLNAVSPYTSPAYTVERQQPSGEEYADYLEAVADLHELPVETGVTVTDVRPAGARAVDGDESTTRAADGGDHELEDGFVLETSDGPIESDFVVWAGGQFGRPRRDVFPGSDLCVHTSEVESWTDHANAASTSEFFVVGGYESGIDAAVGLVEAGCSVRVVDRGAPWLERDPDPSEVLAPYTMERLESIVDTDRLEVAGGMTVEEVRRDADGCFEVSARPVGGSEFSRRSYTTPTRPLLATGFEPNLGPVEAYFPREDGAIELTERDESPTAPGLFLAGPEVTHNGVKFCFIYKFRSRFPVVAETIGNRLGIDTDALEEYREQNMFLEDLSCCKTEMCDC